MSETVVVENLVSTIIPVHNRPDMLQRAVDSVLAQSWPHCEVIISDDGSTDATPELGRALAEAHPGVVHYLWHENRGPGPAREAGRLAARGEFIQHLDSDDVLLPEKFTLQVAALRAHPECGAVYGWTRLVGRAGVDPDEPAKWTGREIETLFPGLLVDRWWCTVSPLYRRAVTDAVGPWTDLRYSQDWEYDARVGALGTKLTLVPSFVAEQHVHDGPRQTGHGRWLSPPDQVRFFNALFDCAQRAGVAADAEERHHFARRVFSHARHCAVSRDVASARACLHLACRAWPAMGQRLLRYERLSDLLGWARLAVLSERAADLRRSLRGIGASAPRQQESGEPSDG